MTKLGERICIACKVPRPASRYVGPYGQLCSFCQEERKQRAPSSRPKSATRLAQTKLRRERYLQAQRERAALNPARTCQRQGCEEPVTTALDEARQCPKHTHVFDIGPRVRSELNVEDYLYTGHEHMVEG